MKKHLLLFFLFSVSLAGICQDKPLTLMPTYEPPVLIMNPDGTYSISNKEPKREIKPDTLRAICMVALFQNGLAHARMGYVVIQQGKRPVYLDCRKRALKLPQVGWGYEIVNPNYKR